MKSSRTSTISRIPLEMPASVRRQLPGFDESGLLVPEYVFADENRQLDFLFAESQILDLQKLSPIVLYGDPGTGKSALAVTLASRWARASNQRPLCVSAAENFAREYAAAVEIDDIDSFQKRYRKCKLLLLDDIEPLVGKNAAQQEFASTLDELESQAAPVIVTCSKIPSTLKLSSSLTSRLSGGYSLELKRPSASAIETILSDLVPAAGSKIQVADLHALCQQLNRSWQAAELKMLVTITQQNAVGPDGIDFDFLHHLASQYFDGNPLSVHDIAKSVGKHLQIKISELRGSTRQANVVRARGLAILLSRKLTGSSLQQIGQFFGGRDHSTILHALRKTEKSLKTDSELAKALVDVQADLLQ